jgi:polyisoprenoid-binding protein YceI
MSTTLHPFTGTYEIDPVHSTVQFAVSHIVSTFRSSFDVQGRLVVDEDGGSLTATTQVDSVSIEEPTEFRQHVVQGDDFFQAAEHPEITFRSTDVTLADDGQAIVTGELTIKTVKQAIRAVGTYRPPTLDPFGGERAGLKLQTTIDRRDWGFSWQMPLPHGGDALGWEVQLSAELELVRSDPR